ncbi:uncharacterized protein AKAME5_000741100 [Lates japonicus]|uniref:Uncharacterized protein n=1 Tax=Lates japonicus TaxID=270547 RepID=A0AAD3R458_LATJO|nr:uncharacterized protein AKAME5_000741100 [Lates japonicus]
MSREQDETGDRMRKRQGTKQSEQRKQNNAPAQYPPHTTALSHMERRFVQTKRQLSFEVPPPESPSLPGAVSVKGFPNTLIQVIRARRQVKPTPTKKGSQGAWGLLSVLPPHAGAHQGGLNGGEDRTEPEQDVRDEKAQGQTEPNRENVSMCPCPHPPQSTTLTWRDAAMVLPRCGFDPILWP